MARNETPGGGSGLSSPMIGATVAVITAAIIAMLLFLSEGETPTEAETVQDATDVEEPTGAGTNPDGVADEETEGLNNETSTDDFVDQSEAGDTTPAIVEPDDGPDPQTDATGLEPPVGDGEAGVDGIEPTQPEDDEDG